MEAENIYFNLWHLNTIDPVSKAIKHSWKLIILNLFNINFVYLKLSNRSRKLSGYIASYASALCTTLLWQYQERTLFGQGINTAAPRIADLWTIYDWIYPVAEEEGLSCLMGISSNGWYSQMHLIELVKHTNGTPKTKNLHPKMNTICINPNSTY